MAADAGADSAWGVLAVDAPTATPERGNISALLLIGALLLISEMPGYRR